MKHRIGDLPERHQYPHGLLQVIEELTPTAKRYLSQRLGEKVSHQLGAMLRSIKTGEVQES